MLGKNSAVNILDAATSTTTGDVHQPVGRNWTFDCYGSTSSGSGAATILIQVANVDVSAVYKTLGTVSLTLGTTVTSDGFASSAAWKYVRAKVSAISGTGATVYVVMGTEGV